MNAKHRIGLFFIALLVFVNLIICGYSNSLRDVLQNKLKYAVIYYQQQVKHYYLQFRGIIPPEIVIKYNNEWERFSFICDSLVLNQQDSISSFRVYIKLLNKVHKDNILSLKDSDKTNRKPKFRRGKRDLFDRHFEKQKKIINNLKDLLSNRFSENELENFDILLQHWWVLPDVELRALRKVKLLPEQRQRLIPISTQLVKASLSTDFFRRPRFMREMIDEEQQETDNKRIKDEFIALVNKVLNNKQIEKWKLNQEKIQDENMQYMERVNPRHFGLSDFPKTDNPEKKQKREMS
jgi:hypothetical protein